MLVKSLLRQKKITLWESDLSCNVCIAPGNWCQQTESYGPSTFLGLTCFDPTDINGLLSISTEITGLQLTQPRTIWDIIE